MKLRGKDTLLDVLNRSSVKNGMWMYLLQIFNTIVPLLTLPYITRILGASKYGTFMIALNIVGYLQVVVEYGFGMSATREVALADRKGRSISSIFSSVLFARGILSLISILIIIVYIAINSKSDVQNRCLLILLTGLLGYWVQQNWLFQGLQDMKYISIVNIMSRVVSTVLIFLFVKSAKNLYLYCFLYTVSPLISGFFGLILATKRYKLEIVRVTVKDVVQEIKNGFYIFTTQLSSKVFGAIGITFLGVFGSSSDVGIYSAIQKIPNIILMAWLPISQVMYPIVSRRMENSFTQGIIFINKMKKIFLPLFLLVAIVIAVFSQSIVEISFGQEYVKSFYWMLPLLLWMLVSINNNFLGIQILLGSGHDKEYSKCFQIGVLFTVVFNFTLIFYFGGNGACIAPLLSEVVLSVMLRREVVKLKNVHKKS